MNAARDTRECLRLERWITAYIDDELDAVHVLDVEQHLQACEPCREQVALTRSVRASLRECEAPKAPSALRARVCAAIVAERKIADAERKPGSGEARRKPAAEAEDFAREDDEVPSGWLSLSKGRPTPVTDEARPKLVKLRFVMPLAALATVALVIGAYQLRDRKEAAQQDTVAHAQSSFDKFIDDLVDAHIQPPPPEVTDYDGLDSFNAYVGVRVPHPQLTGAHYIGAARLHRRAAMLQFAMGDRRRATLYVFDPSRVPVQANRLQPSVVGNSHLYIGRVRGYAVAASERDGVGYALTSDFDDGKTAQLLVAASAH